MALAVFGLTIVFPIRKKSLICALSGRKFCRQQTMRNRFRLEFKHVGLKVRMLKQFRSLKYRIHLLGNGSHE
jgi:hypothetical protein